MVCMFPDSSGVAEGMVDEIVDFVAARDVVSFGLKYFGIKHLPCFGACASWPTTGAD